MSRSLSAAVYTNGLPILLVFSVKIDSGSSSFRPSTKDKRLNIYGIFVKIYTL